MIDLMSATRGAVYRALTAGVQGTPVFDDVPQNTKPPFLRLGAMKSENAGGKSEQVERFLVEIVAVYQGPQRGTLLAMMHAARAALDGQAITAPGVQLQRPFYVMARATDPSETDGVTAVGLLYLTIDAEPA